MTSTHDSHVVGAGMLFRFQTDMEAEKARKKRPDEDPSAFEERKQRAARDAIVNVAGIPSRPGSAPPSPPGGIFLGTGGLFPNNPPRPTELELDLEPGLNGPAVQGTSADNIPHNLEGDIRGFGAQLATDADPRDYSANLRDDIENLGPSDGS